MTPSRDPQVLKMKFNKYTKTNHKAVEVLVKYGTNTFDDDKIILKLSLLQTTELSARTH